MAKKVGIKDAKKDASAKISAKAADAILAESNDVITINQWLKDNYVLTNFSKTDIRHLWNNRYRVNLWRIKLGENYTYIDKSMFVQVNGNVVTVK